MGRGSGVCKFLVIIFTFSLLLQGVCAAESANNISNDTIAEINGSINGSINGTINSTINDEKNNTIIDIISGTVNVTIDGTLKNTQMFSWVLLLPLFFGCFLFLGWVCRYFPEMTSGFVLFMLLLLLAVILLIGFTRNNLVLLLTPLILLPLLYELYHEIKEIDYKNRKLNFVLLLHVILLIEFTILLIGFTKHTLVLEYILVLGYILVILLITSLIRLLLLYVVYNDKKIEDKRGKLKKDDDRKIENNFLYKARVINIIGSVLIWPSILIYFYYHNIQYVTFYGIEDLKFPVYIITASLIGIVSYSLLSIEDDFSHLFSEYEKLSKVWSYLRRFLIAPFIAIIGFYLLIYLLNINMAGDYIKNINNFFVFVFSFIVGAFTKTIEEWIYAWVQKLLPGDKKIEFESRIQNEVKETDFVKKLGLDDDVAYRLYNIKIRKIEELADCEPKTLSKKLNHDIQNPEENDLSSGKSDYSCNYSLEQIKLYIKKAQDYREKDKSKLIGELEELCGHLEMGIKNFKKNTEELKLKEIIEDSEDKENSINSNSTDPTNKYNINPNSTDPHN